MAKLCMGCMNPLPEGSDRCSICGFSAEDSNPGHCLAIATVLQDHYIVGRCMGEGSDSVLYIGYDRLLKEPCLIQEFYPSTLCERAADGRVQPLGGCERPFAEYAGDFRGVMRALARAKDVPGMIPVYDIFDENGTAYAVSDYCAGATLSKKLRQAGGRLHWSEARPLFMSLMSCVSQLHSAGIRHLAISPDTILIGSDGRAHLRAFAIPAARCAGGELKPELADGFAAPEQYDLSGTAALSDATDVYGMAATIFYAVTGNTPPAGNKRAKNSDDLFMSAEIAEELTQPVCVALFNALQVDPAQRTASMAGLRDQLGLEPHVSALVDEAQEDMQHAPADSGKPARGRTLLIVLACVLAAVVLVGAAALLLLRGRNTEKDDPASTPVTLPVISTTTTTEKKAVQYAVPKLVDKSYYDVRDSKLDGDMTITLQYMQYSKKAAGTIISQQPEAGTSAPKGTAITVIVSCGENDEVAVPDVAGWKQEHAKLYLEALGFRVETAMLQASQYDKGLVDSTDPVAGTTKRKGDTITLRVSNVEKAAAPADDGSTALD